MNGREGEIASDYGPNPSHTSDVHSLQLTSLLFYSDLIQQYALLPRRVGTTKYEFSLLSLSTTMNVRISFSRSLNSMALKASRSWTSSCVRRRHTALFSTWTLSSPTFMKIGKSQSCQHKQCVITVGILASCSGCSWYKCQPDYTKGNNTKQWVEILGNLVFQKKSKVS